MNGDKDRYNNRQVISGFRVQSSESRVHDLTGRRPLFDFITPAPMHEQSMNHIFHLHAPFVPPLWIYVDMNPRPPLS